MSLVWHWASCFIANGRLSAAALQRKRDAFVLRGGVPIFFDVRRDKLNIDERLIEAAITTRTKAIVVVHYAGLGCAMDIIMAIAHRYDLLVIEDTAQGLMSQYRGRLLGSIGHLGALSFHETKNIISGEGGALLVNDAVTGTLEAADEAGARLVRLPMWVGLEAEQEGVIEAITRVITALS